MYISVIISGTALIVSLAAISLTVWLNHIQVSPSFKWIKSVNDNSWKLRVRITNLSPRTTTLVSLRLLRGDTVLEDNGYDYQTTKDKLEAEASERDELKRQQQRANFEEQGLKNHIPLSLIRNQLTMRDIQDSVQSFKGIDPLSESREAMDVHRNPAKQSSNNFEEFEPLFGNNKIAFSYWLDGDNLPDKLELTFTGLIANLKRKKLFLIPRIPNQEQHSQDISDQD